MKEMRAMLWFGWTAALAGCSAPQMTRIDRNRDLYETWPIEIRQAVLDGKVEPGMTPDMVRVSWGEPSEVVTNSGVGQEVWIYKKGGSEEMVIDPAAGPMSSTAGIPGLGSNRGGTSLGGGPGPVAAAPIYIPPTPPEIREVVFRDGVVYRADKP